MGRFSDVVWYDVSKALESGAFLVHMANSYAAFIRGGEQDQIFYRNYKSDIRKQ